MPFPKVNELRKSLNITNRISVNTTSQILFFFLQFFRRIYNNNNTSFG